METEAKVGLSATAILAVIGTMAYFEQVSLDKAYADKQCLLQHDIAESVILGGALYCTDKATGNLHRLIIK